MIKTLAIIGGGPAALMVYKRLLNSGADKLSIEIFEATDTLGSGMPYSSKGAGLEHVTNVSANELPGLLTPLDEWVKNLPTGTLDEFGIEAEHFHEKKIVPRLLFGRYLTGQFQALLAEAARIKLPTQIHYRAAVTDIRDLKDRRKVSVMAGDFTYEFDYVIICSGHHWPAEREGTVPGYFDSPYPPAKLARHFNHEVVVRGSSLTAVDAIRTVARSNGRFASKDSQISFEVNDDSPNFRVSMHSRHGMLPCIRVHMEEPHVAGKPLISNQSIKENRQAHDGFLQLDFLFENGFKLPLKDSDPDFYKRIKNMNLESFVDSMMQSREAMEPFDLFKKEYLESKQSIAKERPVYWKEMLSALSFAMNYPAKYLSAEDMLRLQKHLMPLISVVIAFVPQSSCEELMALHDAGRLDLISDGDGGTVKISEKEEIIYHFQDAEGSKKQTVCQTFIDCIGQKHLSLDAFPFKSLVNDGTVSPAHLKFQSLARAKELLADGEENIEEHNGEFYLRVSGADISDYFQVVDQHEKPSERVYLMAVPYMGGFNPDYSGLDFCEHASELIVDNIMKENN